MDNRPNVFGRSRRRVARHRKMHRSSKPRSRPSWQTLSAPASATRAAVGFAAQEISFAGTAGWLRRRANSDIFASPQKGGVLASTRSLKRRRHVEDGSLASLKSGPKQINADHQDLALAA